MAKISQPSDFETALAELNRIVSEMEAGKLSLEDSLQRFERGVGLTRQCQTALKNAEQKVQLLIDQEDSNEAQLNPYHDDTNQP